MPVKGEVPLKDGDTIKVGPLSFKVVIGGKPAPSKPTPPPKPKNAEVTDDDAAAALLSIDDETGGVSVAVTDRAGEDPVPGGSTVMDMPAFTPPPPTGKAPKEETAAEKPEEKKPAEKKKVVTGAAQDAAKAILDKLRAGKRK